MPRITIPVGSKISQTEGKVIEMKIKNTNFWIYGQQKENHLWDAYLINPLTSYRELIKTDITTKSFSLFSNSVLKTPFPYSGKRAENSTIIKKFIKKIINKTICKTITTTQYQPQSQP